jgi:hypothetical protein
MEKQEKKVGLLLGIGIFFMPYIFSWFLLRDGHSTKARVLGLGWMAIIISMVFFSPKNIPTSQNNTTPSLAATQAQPVAAAAPSSLWNYSTSEDKMRKTTTNYASLKSSEKAEEVVTMQFLEYLKASLPVQWIAPSQQNSMMGKSKNSLL